MYLDGYAHLLNIGDTLYLNYTDNDVSYSVKCHVIALDSPAVLEGNGNRYVFNHKTSKSFSSEPKFRVINEHEPKTVFTEYEAHLLSKLLYLANRNLFSQNVCGKFLVYDHTDRTGLSMDVCEAVSEHRKAVSRAMSGFSHKEVADLKNILHEAGCINAEELCYGEKSEPIAVPSFLKRHKADREKE